jgi:hypothetical protein
MKTSSKLVAAAASLLVLTLPNLKATVLVDETFGPTVPPEWQTTNAAVTLYTSDTVGLDGYALVYSRITGGGSDTAQGGYRTFASTTLDEAGKKLEASFLFKGITYAQNNANRVFFGFFNSAGTTSVSDDVGYVGLLRDDTRTDRSSPYTSFRGLDAGPSFEVSGYTGTVYNATISEGTEFYLNNANLDDVFQFTYSITRQSNGDLLLSQTFTNLTTSASFTSSAIIPAAEVLTYTFDTFDIGHFRVGVEFAINNLLITVVPEPGTAVLAMAGWTFLWGCRRRRERHGMSGR